MLISLHLSEDTVGWLTTYLLWSPFFLTCLQNKVWKSTKGNDGTDFSPMRCKENLAGDFLGKNLSFLVKVISVGIAPSPFISFLPVLSERTWLLGIQQPYYNLERMNLRAESQQAKVTIVEEPRRAWDLLAIFSSRTRASNQFSQCKVKWTRYHIFGRKTKVQLFK